MLGAYLPVRPDLLITGMLNMGKFQMLSRFLSSMLARQHMFHFGRVEAIMMCDEKTIEVTANVAETRTDSG